MITHCEQCGQEIEYTPPRFCKGSKCRVKDFRIRHGFRITGKVGRPPSPKIVPEKTEETPIPEKIVEKIEAKPPEEQKWHNHGGLMYPVMEEDKCILEIHPPPLPQQPKFVNEAVGNENQVKTPQIMENVRLVSIDDSRVV